MPPVMRHLIAVLRAMVVAALAIGLLAAPAYAQSPSPSAKGGLCAPWSHCLAGLFMILTILFVAFVGLGYLIQRRGFDKVEHRQGSPDGVPVDKK
jgi:hypothetical protein